MNAISLYPLLVDRAFSLGKQHLSSQNMELLSGLCQERLVMHGDLSDVRDEKVCVVSRGGAD